jgi:hypothetical protein
LFFLVVQSKKSMPTDDEHCNRLKKKLNEPTQFGIFIQCNGPVSCNIYSNETVSSIDSPIIKTQNKNDEYQSTYVISFFS